MEILKLKDKIYNRIVGHFIEKAIKRSTGLEVMINLGELQVIENQDGTVTANVAGSVTGTKSDLGVLLTL